MIPDSSAVLDANTALCHPYDVIKQLQLDDAPPATDWLWRVDVMADRPPAPHRFNHDATVQLRTVGHFIAAPGRSLRLMMFRIIWPTPP